MDADSTIPLFHYVAGGNDLFIEELKCVIRRAWKTCRFVLAWDTKVQRKHADLRGAVFGFALRPCRTTPSFPSIRVFLFRFAPLPSATTRASTRVPSPPFPPLEKKLHLPFPSPTTPHAPRPTIPKIPTGSFFFLVFLICFSFGCGTDRRVRPSSHDARLCARLRSTRADVRDVRRVHALPSRPSRVCALERGKREARVRVAAQDGSHVERRRSTATR